MAVSGADLPYNMPIDTDPQQQEAADKSWSNGRQ
jgi:hypothetical protein